MNTLYLTVSKNRNSSANLGRVSIKKQELQGANDFKLCEIVISTLYMLIREPELDPELQ